MATEMTYVPDQDGPVDFAKVESIELIDFDGVRFVRERTCRIEYVDQNESDPVGIAVCSECGSNSFEVWGIGSYCPNCGARVVG